jgi:hypothetical protein
MRNPVTDQMEQEAERSRRGPRAHERPAGRSGRDMKRNDHRLEFGRI